MVWSRTRLRLLEGLIEFEVGHSLGRRAAQRAAQEDGGVANNTFRNATSDPAGKTKLIDQQWKNRISIWARCSLNCATPEGWRSRRPQASGKESGKSTSCDPRLWLRFETRRGAPGLRR
jgi:hypothetical protein